MDFHLEERRAWIRTSTHTVIFDRDPDFSRFAAKTSGVVTRFIRVWTCAESGRGVSAYLGGVTLGPDGYCTGEVTRVFRRLAARVDSRQDLVQTRAQLNRVLKRAR